MNNEDLEIVINCDKATLTQASEQLTVWHGTYVSPELLGQTLSNFGKPIAQQFTEIEWNLLSMKSENLFQRIMRKVRDAIKQVSKGIGAEGWRSR